MNIENPSDPREALEPSLTALLLGELPDDQARLVRQAISSDPELARTFERLKATTALLEQMETGGNVADGAIQADAPKLSEQRRAQLLQSFKTVHPAQFAQGPRPWNSLLVAVAAVVIALATVTAVLLRVSMKTKSQSMAKLEVLKSESLILRQGTSHSDDRTHSVLTSGAALPIEGQTQVQLLERKLTRPESEARSFDLATDKPITTVINSETPIPGLSSLDLVAGKPVTTASAPERQGGQVASYGENLTTFYRRSPGNEPPAGPKSTSTLLAQQTIVLPSLEAKDALEIWNADGAKLPQSKEMFALSPPGATAEKLPSGIGGSGLGGLADNTPTQVPISGDAPELGALFRQKALNTRSLQESDVTKTERKAGDSTNTTTEPVALDWAARDDSLATRAPAQTSEAFRLRLAESEVLPVNGSVEELGRKPAEVNLPETAKPELQAELQKSAKAAELAQKVELPGLRGEKDKTQLASGAAVAMDDRLGDLKKQDNQTLWAFGLPAGSRNRSDQQDLGVAKASAQAPVPQPEVQTSENAFSTFSLNVSDVSFKLAAASLEQGKLPEPASIRSEEFINAFDYRDPEPANGQPIAFAWERARYPFAQNRDLLRLSIKTAALGRQEGRPLNVVLLLDNSGSMERADRVRIIHEGLRVLSGQLRSGDVISVVTFARTARLWVDGVPGDQAGRVADELDGLTPQGGTNLEQAMNLAYQTAQRHYMANGINRVVLLTDGAANLGDTHPEILKQKVEINRKQGIALDCFGIGWEGYNDDLLEQLARNGDGRYGFLNSPEEAASDFAGQLAGAFHVAAADVKVQVEFNPKRVACYRQIGYAHHQLTREQFRDNTVDAAELGAAEAGNALYVIETNPQGDGPVATLRVRFKIPGTSDFREHEWTVPYTGAAAGLEQSSPSIRLAGTASALSEWLASSPYAAEVTPDQLLPFLNDVSTVYGADPRPQRLEWMIRQAKAISGR